MKRKRIYPMNLYQRVIHHRSYARKIDDRFETYEENVDRYINFLKEKFGSNPKISSELNAIRTYINQLKIVGSMRLFFSAGNAVNAENAMAFNCKYQAIHELKSFPDLLYSLLCTCGVGISVREKHISRLPKLPTKIRLSEESIVVEDTRTGWAVAFYDFLNNIFYNGICKKFDTHKVREKGAPLLTSGGYASGPQPLHDLRDFVEKICVNAADRQLKSIECFDIACMIANCAVQGGVRRAAIITLFDDYDDEMFYAKSKENLLNNTHRYNSNNTMVWYGEDKYIDKLIASNMVNGEPGILFYKNLISKIEKLNRVDDGLDFGVNPCVTGGTLVLTKDGYKPIESIVGTEVEVWNGFEWSMVKPFASGKNEIYSIKFSNGMTVNCTPYHKWHTTSGIKEAKDLTTNDKLIKINMPIIKFDKIFNIDYYSQGFYSTGGNSGYKHSLIYDPKYPCIDRLCGIVKDTSYTNKKFWYHGDMLPKDFVPNGHSIESKLEWLAGVFDGDGNITVNPSSISIHLNSMNYTFLMKVLLLLNELGCQPKLNKMKDEGFNTLPDGHGGSKLYKCQTWYRLLLNAMDVKKLVSLGLNCTRLQIPENLSPNRNAARFITPVKITKTNKHKETYCLTEEKRHTFIANAVITGNCGEVILRSDQYCNLSEVILRPEDTLHEDMLKVRYATILALLQATYTDYGFITTTAKFNQDDDPIIGVSLTGLCDCPQYSSDNDYETRLSILKQVVDNTVNEFWKVVGLKNKPSASTCVKPSGTVSKLSNTSSGIHPRYSKFYVNRIIIGKESGLYESLAESGVPYLEFDSIDGRVFEFPMKAPENAITVEQMSAVDQLRYTNNVNNVWCDHNTSVTIYVKQDEWEDVKKIIKGENTFISLSFLPQEITADTSGFLYLPLESITEEEYNRRAEIESKIDINQVFNIKETTANNHREFACVGGSCSF